MTAEDVIAHELAWFKAGDETATRQFRDVVGVLGVRGDDLDWDYLDRLATDLDVAGLLVRARSAALDDNA